MYLIFLFAVIYACVSLVFSFTVICLCVSVYLFTFICAFASLMFIYSYLCQCISHIFVYSYLCRRIPYHYIHSSVSVQFLYLSKHANLLCVALPFPSPFHHAIIFLSPDKYPTLQIFFFTPWFRSGSQIQNTSSSARIFVQCSLHPLCRAR